MHIPKECVVELNTSGFGTTFQTQLCWMTSLVFLLLPFKLSGTTKHRPRTSKKLSKLVYPECFGKNMYHLRISLDILEIYVSEHDLLSNECTSMCLHLHMEHGFCANFMPLRLSIICVQQP